MLPSVFFPSVPGVLGGCCPVCVLLLLLQGSAVLSLGWSESLLQPPRPPLLHVQLLCACELVVGRWFVDKSEIPAPLGGCSLGRISTNCFVSVLSCRDPALVCLTWVTLSGMPAGMAAWPSSSGTPVLGTYWGQPGCWSVTRRPLFRGESYPLRALTVAFQSLWPAWANSSQQTPIL